MEARFEAVYCPRCGDMVCDMLNGGRGLWRVKCQNRRCKARVWMLADGMDVRVWTADSPPRVV